MNRNIMTSAFNISLIGPVLICLFISNAVAQNPLINDQFTADPSAKVFGDKVYVYPSHDVNCGTDWFCMKDYHVFSSDNLVDWTDHGVIVSQNEVDWVDSTANAMWAPDAIERNGRYYFYFPAIGDSTKGFQGRRIGVATSDSPSGPFDPQPEPIKNVHGIDPNIFIDKDGQAYLYWSGEDIYVAKLKDNMLELDSEPQVLGNLPKQGHKEGPYMIERNGTYYLTYPHVEHKTERLEYATSDNPMGPFTVKGVIMEAFPDCWTNHQSIVQYDYQWYLFCHHNDYSPDFDKNRSIRADSLFFNPDGTIQKVTPTLRGVGITKATQKIQIDRYSEISDKGTSIAFLDTIDTFKGWKTVLSTADAWVKYNSVDFNSDTLTSVNLKAWSETRGTVQVRQNSVDGPVIAEINVPKENKWNVLKAPLSSYNSGRHNLFVTLKNGSAVEIEWVRFE